MDNLSSNIFCGLSQLDRARLRIMTKGQARDQVSRSVTPGLLLRIVCSNSCVAISGLVGSLSIKVRIIFNIHPTSAYWTQWLGSIWSQIATLDLGFAHHCGCMRSGSRMGWWRWVINIGLFELCVYDSQCVYLWHLFVFLVCIQSIYPFDLSIRSIH